MKNMFMDYPRINIESIMARSTELAQYDPYAIRREKIRWVAQNGMVTIGGIVQCVEPVTGSSFKPYWGANIRETQHTSKKQSCFHIAHFSFKSIGGQLLTIRRKL